MRSLPKAPTHDQCRESNPRPLDLRSSALPTGPRDPINRFLYLLCHSIKKEQRKERDREEKKQEVQQGSREMGENFPLWFQTYWH